MEGCCDGNGRRSPRARAPLSLEDDPHSVLMLCKRKGSAGRGTGLAPVSG